MKLIKQIIFSNFSSIIRLWAVWEKATIIPDEYQNMWRRDAYGNLIFFFDYGSINSVFGWEVDHIFPKALGGTDDISNLQPLQWRANRRKRDRVEPFPLPYLYSPAILSLMRGH